MKAHLFCLLLIAAAGCNGQPTSTDQPADVIEHLAESPVAAAEVDSLEAPQKLKVRLFENQRLRFERLSDLSRVIVELEGRKGREVIDWLGRIKSGVPTNMSGGGKPPTVEIHCHRECEEDSCTKVCCLEIAGSAATYCFPNPSR
jgi:hypothetical protein